MSLKKFPKTKIGVTGGIGSGKSHVCRLIERRGFPVFYCDAEARRLMVTDASLREDLVRLVGPGLYAPDGSLVKSAMRAYLCQGPQAAARVDALVHPCVARAFREWAQARQAPKLFMECALLFESGFDRLVDVTWLVSAPLELRLRRVAERDGVTPAQVRRWMALQMDDADRLARADYVIPNGEGDHPEVLLDTLLSD